MKIAADKNVGDMMSNMTSVRNYIFYPPTRVTGFPKARFIQQQVVGPLIKSIAAAHGTITERLLIVFKIQSLVTSIYLV